MNPEPLNLEDLWDWFEKKFGTDAMNRYYGYETNELIKEIKQRIKSACEFYLKYKDDPERFFKDFGLTHPFAKKEKLRPVMANFMKKCGIQKYQAALFKLAFKDVLGGGD